MIRLLSPGFAWALAVPAVILALYLLRRKYLQQQVPSVFLWRKSVKDYAANRPFQKLMKNLLLPLQLLAALALALALMRPAVSGGKAGRTVLVFDVSGSMLTVSEGKTRLDTAKEEALQLIGDLPAEEEITVLAAGAETERLALAADHETAEKAVQDITCGRDTADMDRALSLADAVARDGKEEAGTTVVVFSDNYRPEQMNVRGAAFGLRIVNCGRGEENRSLYSLEARDGQAYARAANFGDECTLTLVCEADGTLSDAREVTIPAGGTAGIRFDIPETARRVRAVIREKDALREDNTAEAPVRHVVEKKVAVTSDSVFLESALRVRPDLTVLRTETGALASTEADLYILGSDPMIITRSLPEEGYDEAATAFGPFSWEETDRGVSRDAAPAVSESPLTNGVTMKNVFFRTVRPVTGGRAAVTLDGERIIAYTEDTAVIGFDLHDSNLPLKYDFPVLIQNILDMLLPEETECAGDAAAPMPLAESDVRTVAPDYEPEGTKAESEKGRELTGILLALFLLLLVAEMGVSRYVG